MHKSLIVFFSLSFVMLSVLPAQSGVEAWLRVTPSLFSSYHEQARDAGVSPEEIWGDFDTWFLDVGATVPIWKSLFFYGSARGGLIAENKMYLGTDDDFLTIGGYMAGFEAGALWRLLDSPLWRLDVLACFSLLKGNKTFTDFTSSGTIINEGEFGSYSFTMFGPNARLALTAQPSKHLPLTIRSTVFGSPLFENHNSVTGWSADPKKEYSAGYRYGADILAGWKTGNRAEFSAGYCFERMYFSSSPEVTHDLDILFHGPVFQVTLMF